MQIEIIDWNRNNDEIVYNFWHFNRLLYILELKI